MKKLTAVLIIAAMFLCGCSNGGTAEAPVSRIDVWRAVSSEYTGLLGLIYSETVTVSAKESELETALSAFGTKSGDERLYCPIPSGIEISAANADGLVTAELSGDITVSSGMDMSVLAACLTQTLCALPEVQAITIVCGDEVLFDALTPSDLMLKNTVISPTSAQLRLYFPKTDGSGMGWEYRSITLSDGNAAERCIVEELLKGASSPDLTSTIPPETVLLSVSTESGMCTVSLSSAFLGGDATTEEAAQGAVNSLAYSLTSIKSVSAVQLLIDGRSASTVCGVDISKPLVRENKQ